MPVHIRQLTPLAFLERSADVFADRVAVVNGDERLTHAELAAEVTRLANALRASGIAPGDRVAYLAPNSIATCWSGTSRSRWRAASWSPSTPASPPLEVRFDPAPLRVADARGPRVAAPSTVLPVIDRPRGGGGGVGTASATAPRSPGRRMRSSVPAARTRPCRGPSATRTRRSRSTTRPAPRATEGRDVHAPRRVPERARRDIDPPWPAPCTCGRSRCSTATAGATRGR